MKNDPRFSPASDGHAAAVPGRRRHLPGLAQCLAGGLALAALGTLAIPAWSETAGRGNQAKLVFQAKQIGLALKLFAGDNDGIYPADGTPENLKAPTTSNAAFAPLFPAYLASESIFGDPSSAYQTRKPDDVVDNPYTGHPVNTLASGENVYSYLMGLTDAGNLRAPLVMEGTDGTGHYVSDPAKLGGAGGGVDAVVIRLDNSAPVELLAGPAAARFAVRAVRWGAELAIDVIERARRCLVADC